MNRTPWLALSVVLLAPGLARPADLAGPAAGTRALSPAVVLARFESTPEHGEAWDAATVEIEASIPKLGKRASLVATRRTMPDGRIEYQVVASDGDSMVKRQVIARFLSAEVKASGERASSVSLTPANYRFRYAGTADDGGGPAYVFHIAPRKKRVGLIKGELWIDAASGLAVRQAGRLVRSPSIFLRRVEITRETKLQDGAPGARVTHVRIDTRLVGRAELTITELPGAAAPAVANLASAIE